MFKGRIKKIYSYRQVLISMTISQLKAKYAGSKLGIWWAVIVPLLLAGSINLVFTRAFNIKFNHYTLFVLSGIIPWLFFANALMEAVNSFVGNVSLIKQSIFPREFVPIASISGNLLNFLIGFIFMLPLFIIVNYKVLFMAVFLIILIMCHFLFIVGLGLLFSTINVFFRDLAHFLSVGFMIWFWITPIFYSLDMLSFPLRWICLINPMSLYVIAYRKLLFEASGLSLLMIGALILVSFVTFFVGYMVFIRNEKNLLKQI